MEHNKKDTDTFKGFEIEITEKYFAKRFINQYNYDCDNITAFMNIVDGFYSQYIHEIIMVGSCTTITSIDAINVKYDLIWLNIAEAVNKEVGYNLIKTDFFAVVMGNMAGRGLSLFNT